MTKRQEFIARKDAEECLKFAAVKIKYYYDNGHKPINLTLDFLVYLCLRKGYLIKADKDKPKKK